MVSFGSELRTAAVATRPHERGLMPAQTWEYSFRFVVLSPDSGLAVMKAFIADTLNPDGVRGWEAIGVFPSPTNHNEVFVILKRPIPAGGKQGE